MSKKVISVTLDSDIVKKLKQLSENYSISVSAVVSILLAKSIIGNESKQDSLL